MTKAEANRKNALKSTGPKTLRGKRNSRSNALKHGLYSKELLVSEADKSEFEEMRAGLKAQLKPGTVQGWLAFDNYFACSWRCKLAMRLEQRQFARQLQDEQRENARGEAPDVDAGIEGWYGSSRAYIRAGVRVLGYARAEFDQLGYFGKETKSLLTKVFGQGFLESLIHWNTMSKDAILIANHLADHREMFGDIEPEPDAEKSNVVLDPQQGREMVLKLIDQQRQFLEDLLRIRERNLPEGRPDGTQSSDFNPRFVASANRELRHALDWYFYLKDKGL